LAQYYVAPGRSLVCSVGKVFEAGEITGGHLGISDPEVAEKRLEVLVDKGVLLRVMPGTLPEDVVAAARAEKAARTPGPLEVTDGAQAAQDPAVSAVPPPTAPAAPPAPTPPAPAPVTAEPSESP